MTDTLQTAALSRTQHAVARRLRDVGHRATPQRLLILGVFAPGEHLTVDEVHARVNALSPVVNVSTVYRTLELFRDIGLLSETDLGTGSRQYELLEGARHHHLICRVCGEMLVIDDDVMRDLSDVLRERYRFEARIDHLALFGRCEVCAAP
jgi:Fur family transcriptional regulator, ferric uptake regulator